MMKFSKAVNLLQTAAGKKWKYMEYMEDTYKNFIFCVKMAKNGLFGGEEALLFIFF